MSPAPKRTFGEADLAEFRARMDELAAAFGQPTVTGAYVAFTDGACLGNPAGHGGWAAAHFEVPASGNVTTLPAGLHDVSLLYGHLSSTTNNRAEALGVLAALEWTPPGSRLHLHSDSELTVKVVSRVYRARANPEIWELIFATLATRRVELVPRWVRGHAGDPGNELADRLSQYGARNAPLDALADLYVGGPDLFPASPSPAAPSAPPSELAGLVPRGAWETEFLQSISKQLRARRALSPKQQAIIDRMRARQ